jgi:hypothetical protein
MSVVTKRGVRRENIKVLILECFQKSKTNICTTEEVLDYIKSVPVTRAPGITKPRKWAPTPVQLGQVLRISGAHIIGHEYTHGRCKTLWSMDVDIKE